MGLTQLEENGNVRNWNFIGIPLCRPEKNGACRQKIRMVWLDYNAGLHQIEGSHLKSEIVEKMMTAELTDHRPWGHYTVLTDEADHKVKRIIVAPVRRLSLQRHQHRSEHWFIISGEGLVTVGTTQKRLRCGDSIDIPVGSLHRMENPGNKELCFIEIQTGDYFGEDDIERLEDDFSRME